LMTVIKSALHTVSTHSERSLFFIFFFKGCWSFCGTFFSFSFTEDPGFPRWPPLYHCSLSATYSATRICISNYKVPCALPTTQSKCYKSIAALQSGRSEIL
jgi:hypothetical protein